MGILRDTLEAIRDLKSIGNVADFAKRRKFSSISKRSLEGTLQFPVLASKSLDIDTLQMTSKALERQFATFAQVSMTMDPTLNLSSEKDIQGYLRKFHQNIGTRDSINDGLGMFRGAFENATLYSHEKENLLLHAVVCEGSTGTVNIDNKNQLVDVFDHINMESLNSMFRPIEAKYDFPDKALSDYHNGVVTEARGSEDDDGSTPYQRKRDRQKDYQDKRDFEYRVAMDRVRLDNEDRRMNLEKDKLAASNIRTPKELTPKDRDIIQVPQNILKDNDVRKANEMVPTTMHIRVMLFDDNKQGQGFFDFIIGIKTTLHPINSDEIMTNLVSAAKNNSKAFNFIRWTTGEISFFRDFLFNIKELEDDVFNRSSGASNWWITLKRRKTLAKFRDNTFMSKGQLLPNTSIVISMDEAEYLKSTFGYDMMDPDFVDKIMKQYFLLSFVVIDNASQIGHFLFDGQTEYQTYTFSSLEKENTNKADIKEVLKLVNRSNLI